MITHDSIRKPWENAITANTAQASGGFITPDTMLETDVKLITARFPHIRESVRSGYLPNGFYATIPYSGRFGEGYIIATPRSRSSVNCTYYLNNRKRGAVNGSEIQNHQ